MLAFKDFINLDKKKPHIDDGDATENYGHDKYKISTKTDPVLDDIVQERPLSIAREQEIDAYEPKQEDKFKSKSINFKDFDDLLIGFEDGPLKSNPLADRDNTALFGKVSPEELMMSNLETQAGTSNKLNTLLRQKETGQSINEIQEEDKALGKERDKSYKEALDDFMNDYNKLPKTTDKTELKLREKGRRKTIEEIAKITNEPKIIGKKFMRKRTVIRPVVPVVPVPVAPVKVASKPEGKVSSLIKQFDKLALTPKSATKSKPKESNDKLTFSTPKLPPQSPLKQSLKLLTPDTDDTKNLTVKVMKSMAKDQHIKRYSTMNKSELITALNIHGSLKETKSI
jgi:hypothetical protein